MLSTVLLAYVHTPRNLDKLMLFCHVWMHVIHRSLHRNLQSHPRVYTFYLNNRDIYTNHSLFPKRTSHRPPNHIPRQPTLSPRTHSALHTRPHIHPSIATLHNTLPPAVSNIRPHDPRIGWPKHPNTPLQSILTHTFTVIPSNLQRLLHES